MPTRRTAEDDAVHPVAVTADLEIDDKILGPFTARQCAYLAAGAVVLWLGYAALRHLVPAPVLTLTALVLAGSLIAAITVRRDGLTLDRYAAAGLRHQRAPELRVTADPEVRLADTLAPLDVPAFGIEEPGVLDLGPDGAAVLVECGTVNLALRSGAEANAVLGAFARALNAMSGPFAFTLAAHRIDLTAPADHLEAGASGLAHPLLEARALGHADFLRDLAASYDLTARRVLLTIREPGPLGSATITATHRAHQAAQLLAACGIDTRVLDAHQATAALTAACDPRRDHRAARLAPPGAAIRLAETESPCAEES